MTKKRKRYPTLEEKIARPWCYYCERDFDDLKILISHQKAKHFKCLKCGRRLNTAGGLNVHMTQVHKEQLTSVDNANPGRQTLDVEIFGMEGVPEELVVQHSRAVTEKHFTDAAEFQQRTGNVMYGFGTGNQTDPKKPRVHEKVPDIVKRVDKFVDDKRNGVYVQEAPVPLLPAHITPPPYVTPAGHFFGAPPQPPMATGPQALPQRPQNMPDSAAIAASVDELIAGAGTQPSALGPAATEKKAKKERNIKMIYMSEDVSPEEKMFERYISSH